MQRRRGVGGGERPALFRFRSVRRGEKLKMEKRIVHAELKGGACVIPADAVHVAQRRDLRLPLHRGAVIDRYGAYLDGVPRRFGVQSAVLDAAAIHRPFAESKFIEKLLRPRFGALKLFDGGTALIGMRKAEEAVLHKSRRIVRERIGEDTVQIEVAAAAVGCRKRVGERAAERVRPYGVVPLGEIGAQRRIGFLRTEDPIVFRPLLRIRRGVIERLRLIDAALKLQPRRGDGLWLVAIERFERVGSENRLPFHDLFGD